MAGNTHKRGLASASESTKKRVAKMGGEASGRARSARAKRS